MSLTEFAPPGTTDDLSARGLRRWSQDLHELFDAQTIGDKTDPGDTPRPQFFNPVSTVTGADRTTKVMRWGAFPRKLARVPTPQRWKLGEDRDRQEEYCEWSAVRDRANKIIRACFTTEVPSYYHLLAADDPQKLLAVYREHVGPDVVLKDLLTSTKAYRPRNPWNVIGAMHMVQPNNTLDAAVVLVAQSTILRSADGAPLTNANDLIRCGVAADIDRNSDPLIVTDVNALARQGAMISLEDPVGLYLDGLQTDGWVTPDGSDPNSYWKVTRGSPTHAIRATYEVPSDRGFIVQDITINGRAITSPSQIAEFIQVKVTGAAFGFGRHTAQPRRCAGNERGKPEGLESLSEDSDAGAELPPIAQLIERSRRFR